MKKHWLASKRKIGRIEASDEFFEANLEVLNELFKVFYPVFITTHPFIPNAKMLMGYSEQFDEINEFDEAPLYRSKIEFDGELDSFTVNFELVK